MLTIIGNISSAGVVSKVSLLFSSRCGMGLGRRLGAGSEAASKALPALSAREHEHPFDGPVLFCFGQTLLRADARWDRARAMVRLPVLLSVVPTCSSWDLHCIACARARAIVVGQWSHPAPFPRMPCLFRCRMLS